MFVINKQHRAIDPLSLIPRLLTKAKSLWMRYTYPFRDIGRAVSFHYSVELTRDVAGAIEIGDNVSIMKDAWLNLMKSTSNDLPRLKIGNGCKIGRRSTLSCYKQIILEDDVLLAPAVLIMDHNHAYSDITRPVHAQGLSEGGKILIGANSWLGYGCVVSCGRGELVVGNNCVIGAHAVVTKSVPPYSVVAGNPGVVIKYFDLESGTWVRAHGEARQ